MSLQIKGNTRGLAHSQVKKLERLYRRRVDPGEIVSPELAREIYHTAQELGRRIGVLVSREGIIEEVFVGAKDMLYLPDLGRYRLGRGRLRLLRLIFSDLSKHEEPHIPPDIYTDLEKLRLDMIVSVKTLTSKISMTYAHLLPPSPSLNGRVRTEKVEDIRSFNVNFIEFIEELQAELDTHSKHISVSSNPQAMLVGVYRKGDRDSENSMQELRELTRTSGVEVIDTLIQKREPDPKTLLGKGKIEEVVLRCLQLDASLLVFDTELKPSQWRAITNATEVKVIDRTMLILDIFAQHAKSSEGRLQVELAQLKYNLPRLVEKDAGLSRLTGGIGGRGPGETKLEIGRRRIRDRISELEARIQKLSEERGLRKQRRKESKTPLVSILGYTNVGKSTLFNVLTKSEVLVEDKLFATLDPSQRKLVIPGDSVSFNPITLILSDTVGFIKNLPKEVTNAFRATLDELHDAALLVHVLDASDPNIHRAKESVDEILMSLELGDVPQIIVLNKVDLVKVEKIQELEKEFNAVSVSAKEKKGLTLLLQHLRKYFFF